MIETLSQRAAIAARDGIEKAIHALEMSVKIEMKDQPHSKTNIYFAKLREEELAALEELKKLRAVLHGRVFDAYKEENPAKT